jgi:hypothetical protein
MGRRKNDTAWGNHVVDAVNDTWAGRYKWRRSGSRWVTTWRHGFYKIYISNGRMIFTAPCRVVSQRYISDVSAGPLLEAILFTYKKEKKDDEA